MRVMTKFLLFCATFFLLQSVIAMTSASPVGYWKTIDDVTGQPKSILHIYQSGDSLYGQVVKIFPRPGYDQNEVCSACEGSKHNQRIVGMVVMNDLKLDAKNPGQWTDGSIMDPLNGKTYRCTITLINNGARLNVRGYLGISLFGRTQTWIRVGS